MAAPRGWFELQETADQLASAGKLVVQLHRHEILLLWNDGEPVALSNVCIHRGRKLNEGVMLGTRLVCAGHQWAYEVTTGYCKARERYQPRYSLEVRDGENVVAVSRDRSLGRPAPVWRARWTAGWTRPRRGGRGPGEVMPPVRTRSSGWPSPHSSATEPPKLLASAGYRARMAPFVGASREGLRDGLVRVFDRVRDSGESRWVSLEAPTGWGKTRVCREFYNKLAARQPSPRYWPPGITDTNRKAVVPADKREAKSLPEFLWWGVSCEASQGIGAEALRSFLGQLEGHAPYVGLACRRNRGLAERTIEGFVQESKKAAKAVALELAGQFIPLLGLMRYLAGGVVDVVQGRLDDIRLVNEASDIGSNRDKLAPNVVNDLCVLGRDEFPMVMFIEDLHLADDALLEVIGGLLRRGSHLLVVTTTWPDMIDEDLALSALAHDLDGRLLRVKDGERGDRSAEWGFPACASFADLAVDDRERIVLAHYRNADPGTVVRLADRYPNPGALVQVCKMPRYVNKFGQSGALNIGPEEIATLPDGTLELYEVHWNQLPERLRLRYAIAAAIAPEEIDDQAGLGHRAWIDPILDMVIERLGLPTSTDLAGDPSAPLDVYGWVVHVDKHQRRWAETDQHHVAKVLGRTLRNRHLIDADERVYRTLADVVLQHGEGNVLLARTIVALDVRGALADPALIVSAIPAVLADLGHDITREPERARLYRRYLELVERAPRSVDAETDIAVRFNGIDAVGSTGRPDLAAVEFAELVNLAREVHGPDHARTLATRNKLAGALFESGSRAEAMTMYTELVEDQSEALGDCHPDTMESRNDLALALRYEDRLGEAIDIYERVIADQVRELGDCHPHTMVSRNNHASALREDGKLDEAANKLDQLISDRTRELGEDHPHTLMSRHHLAVVLWAQRRFEEATEWNEQLIADRTRVLGRDHPNTLVSRNSLVIALRDANQLEQAETLNEELIADRTRVLDSQHPFTLVSRKTRASILLAQGRVREAVQEYERVLADQCQHLDRDHRDTRQTRADLAHARSQLDDPDASQAETS